MLREGDENGKAEAKRITNGTFLSVQLGSGLTTTASDAVDLQDGTVGGRRGSRGGRGRCLSGLETEMKEEL